MAARDSDFPATLDPAVQRHLKAGGISGLEALWCEIGKGESHGGLAAVVAATGADRPALIRGLTDRAVHRGEEKGKSWPRRHALDLLLIACAVVLAWLVWRAVPRASAVAIAERDLAAGERLGAAEVAGAPAGSLSDRRTLRPIPEGSYILPEWLEEVSPLVKEEALLGRSRVTFRVSAADVEELSDLPALVSLVISSKGGNGKPPATLWLRNVPIVAVEQDGDAPSIAAALNDAEIQALRPLLPEDRVYVAQPIR